MRVLLTTWGSLGDLHPFLRLGEELVAQGNSVTLAAHPMWAEKCAEAGLDFLPMGAPESMEGVFSSPQMMTNRWMGILAMRGIAEHGIEPMMEDSFRVLMAATREHDVLVAHQVVFAARSVAELTGIPWISVVMVPGVVPSREWFPSTMKRYRGLGPVAHGVNRFGWTAASVSMWPIYDRVMNRHRRKHGLKPLRNVIFRESMSKRCTLVLSSRHVFPPPHDWPLSVRMTGYCIWKPTNEPELHPALEEFLDEGPPPWLFTLGSAAVLFPGNFYRIAAETMREMPRERAIFLIGQNDLSAFDLPPNVLALAYLPFDRIMPRCRAVVHQCGAGTMAQSLLAGLPSVAVPFAFDQPGNANRLVQLGAGEKVSPEKMTPMRLRQAMERVLAGSHAAAARRIGSKLKEEDGPRVAATWIERTPGGA